ncbi:MAG: hypothetical protein IKD93_08240 [Firmicutes bacterium]|nr:hypothetical protein [Bacillota bacterium]
MEQDREDAVRKLTETAGAGDGQGRQYLTASGRTPLLSPEEEPACARRTEEGDEAARDRLREANRGLVILIARHYTDRGLPFPDLIREGDLGLRQAVEKFDSRRDGSFPAFAAWWIWQAIVRAIAAQSRETGPD